MTTANELRRQFCCRKNTDSMPENVGGIGGFYEFLEALADPEDEQHDDLMEWGGDFEPEEFDAEQATREMKDGLPGWRLM